MTHRIDRRQQGSSDGPVRVVFVSEIPTPYRLPLYRRLAERPELDVEVLFCAATEPDRPWALEDLEHVPHQVMRGFSPAVRTRRNTFVYEVNPGIVGELTRRRPELLVVGGYSVFAEQAAIAFARLRGVPYLLHSESQPAKPRAAWVRAAKRALLPSVVGRAAAGLAVGSLAARYLAEYGLPPERIRIFPNTIDVEGYAARARAARAEAGDLRRRRELPERFVLFAGRLVEAKGVGVLCEALRGLGADAPPVVVAGEGPLRERLASEPSVRPVGFQQRDALIELMALADATVVPSLDEPWGVVVNEALACGSPVIATEAVGAAYDLVEDGVNGRVVPAGDAGALAEALRRPLPPLEPAQGRIARWTYDFAVEQFLEAVDLALG